MAFAPRTAMMMPVAPPAAHTLLVLGADCADELREFVTPDACGFEVHAEATAVDAAKWAAAATSRNAIVRAIVVTLGSDSGSGISERDSGLRLIASARSDTRVAPFALRVVYSRAAVDNVLTRQLCAQLGAHVVTHDSASLLHVLRQVAQEGTRSGGGSPGPLICPFCKRTDLSEDELWTHMPLFHVNDERRPSVKCCKKPRNLFNHIHNNHGPCAPERLERTPDGHDVTTLSAFALVVCRRKTDGRFLLTQERRGVGYWMPGGHVDAGERLEVAAVRETLEEAGVDVRLTGVLRVEFTPHKKHSRMRVIFLAEPLDEAKAVAKTVPDFESGGAAWVEYAHIADAVTASELQEEIKTFKARRLPGGLGGRARLAAAWAGAGAGSGDTAAMTATLEARASGPGSDADRRLRLRSPAPREWSRYLVEGGVALPLSMLSLEGEPAPRIAVAGAHGEPDAGAAAGSACSGKA